MTDYTESLVTSILNDPFAHTWSIQGLGMLRTYLDDERVNRLHIWDAGKAVTDVSTIHDHPWDFASRIIWGELHNQRYVLDDGGENPEFLAARIRCGAGGGLISEPEHVRIGAKNIELYGPGDTYSQEAPELHESFPASGTVTVITRSFKAERDIATVCWKTGEWVSAEPRPATRQEVEHFIALARTAREAASASR